MKKYFFTLPILFALLTLPIEAFAQGLVTCTGVYQGEGSIPCDICTFMTMINRLVQWLIVFLTIVAVLMLAVAGFKLVTSAGNPSALQQAKDMMANILIGFLIVLSAWLIVDTLIKTVTGDDYGVWNRTGDACLNMTQPVDSPASAPEPATAPGAVAYSPVAASPAGSLCFNGPDGAPDTADDVCVAAQSVDGSDYAIPPDPPAGYLAPDAYIGPDTIAENPQISPNFRLCDVTNCDEARRRGDYVAIDPFAVAQLEKVREGLGGDLQVNSGYRSPAYNASIGGAGHSRHMYGDAFDVAVTANNPQSKIVAECRAAGATNVYTYNSGTHVHCDWRGATRPD